MIERKRFAKAKIGIFAVSHGIYDSQFPGLYDNFRKYHADLINKLEGNGVEIADFGIVDSSERAFEVAEEMRGASLDLLVCNMITYATSSVFAPILRNSGVPMILAALQPRSAMDYTKASTFMQLENDNICSVPEFMGVAARMGKKIYDVVIGKLYNDEEADRELRRWCDIAKVLNSLRGARMGLMGHTLEAMYDMHANPTAIAAAFGVHVPLLEVDEVAEIYKSVTDEEIAEQVAIIDREFDTPDPGSDPLATKLTEADKLRAARAAATLEKFVEKRGLTGLAYYYEGAPDSLNREVVSNFIVGNSILNAEGVPMCGEYDIKTCIAMLIMDRLGIGGSFAELHPFDFDGDFILVGHDGPHHIAIADGKPKLRSLSKYHGKFGSGASVEFKIKSGEITIFGITERADGSFKFVIGEGYSEDGPIPPTGNTNTRGRFLPDTKTFIKKWVMEGPTHHYALGVGHHAETIAKIAEVLGIDYVIVK